MKPLQVTDAKASLGVFIDWTNRHCPFKSSNLSTDDMLLISIPPIANKAPSAATNSWSNLPRLVDAIYF